MPKIAKIELLSKIKKTIPIKLRVPESISITVIIVNKNGTEFLKGEFEKWEVNQSKFPFLSIILSKPDCKNKIAINKTVKI